MEMNKQTLEWIMELSDNRPIIVDANEGDYTVEPLNKIEPNTLSELRSITINTLDGLVEYLKSEIDPLLKDDNAQNLDCRYEKLLINVLSPTQVELMSPLFGYHRQRELIARIDALIPNLSLDKYISQESMIISLQSQFVDKGDRETVLSIASNIVKEESAQATDDGMTQRVVKKAGVATLAEAKIPNPVLLAPYRTFVEVEQPVSPFVFRIKDSQFPDDIGFGIFEADGGAWKVGAVRSIKGYLQNKLTDFPVVIIG